MQYWIGLTEEEYIDLKDILRDMKSNIYSIEGRDSFEWELDSLEQLLDKLDRMV